MTSRVALVTGAGRNVGQGIAVALAEAGYRVAVNDLDDQRAKQTVELISGSGGTAVSAPFDVTDPEAVASAVAQVHQELGPIDVVVNNAGIAEGGMAGPFLDSTPSDWHTHIGINMIGAANVLHAALPGMVERGWGRIIQISSGASSVGLNIGVSFYGGSKAGIEGFLRHLSREVGPSGVTVNSLALGLMDNVGTDIPTMKELLAGIPVGRLGKPSDVGGAVLWLCSEPGAWVTGQTIHINGGSVNGR
ncbi:SDR family NAD(P)-dependent oxidoreductase [Streptomyces niveus]|uniref:SDR family NAD(P)-dependent oxidoreductase n=1 Tax=Streptomyces niveus TaxID=193462 RepID=UPI00343AE571